MSFVGLALLWGVHSLGVGLLVVRRLSWQPLEKVLLAVFLSHGLLYAAQVAVYFASAPPRWMLAVTAANLAGLVLGRAELARWWRDAELRATLAPFAVFAASLLLLTVTLRHFSGGGWYGDWFEHYERTLFFAEQKALTTRFLQDVYTLGARPPFLNAVLSGLLVQSGTSFAHYQLAIGLCNALVFLPGALLARRLHPRSAWWLCALLLLTPFVFQNFVFTWTRTYASFLTLAGVAFYQRGMDGSDETEPGRFVAAFTLLAAASITHYSAGPYLLFLAIHYLAVTFRHRGRPRRELALLSGAGALVLAAWFGWALSLLGVEETFASNTTAQGLGGRGFGEVGAITAGNVFASLVPMSLRGMEVPLFAGLGEPLARLRDQWFPFYQENAFGLVGSSAGPLLLWVAWRDVRGGAVDRERAIFWLAFAVWNVVLGVAANPTSHATPLAHIGLQPLALLALCYLAGRAPQLPSPAVALLVAGKLFDALLGIWIHALAMSHTFPVVFLEGRTRILGDYGGIAMRNFAEKLRFDFHFLGDLLPEASLVPLQLAAHALALGALVRALRSRRGARR